MSKHIVRDCISTYALLYTEYTLLYSRIQAVYMHILCHTQLYS